MDIFKDLYLSIMEKLPTFTSSVGSKEEIDTINCIAEILNEPKYADYRVETQINYATNTIDFDIFEMA